MVLFLKRGTPKDPGEYLTIDNAGKWGVIRWSGVDWMPRTDVNLWTRLPETRVEVNIVIDERRR